MMTKDDWLNWHAKQDAAMRTLAKDGDKLRLIVRGELVCPVCHDDRLVNRMDYTHPYKHGRLTSIECVCLPLRQYKKLVDQLPLKYRDVSLSKLTPSSHSRMPLDEQAALYDELRATPLKSYAFFSAPGWSKTTATVALYKRALWDRIVVNRPDQNFLGLTDSGVGVWRISAPLLIQQCQDYVTGRTDNVPEIRANAIKRLGAKKIQPRLYLEEIDKFKLTEFAEAELWRIIDMIYEAEGLLTVNSNLSPQEFESRFGGPIARRIAEMCVVKSYFGG